MKCPRDGSELKEERHDSGVMVDACDACDGVWLDAGELEKVEKTVEHDRAKLMLGLDEWIANRGLQRAQKKVATCPKCGAEMATREYAYASQIEIDACPTGCGVWLDGGELQAIEVFFERQRQAQVEETLPSNGVAHVAWSLRGFFAGLLKPKLARK